MTLPLTFAETYPGGRVLLMLGTHQVGAVFPPCGEGAVILIGRAA